MSTFYLGWGEKAQGAPYYSPFLRSNEAVSQVLDEVFGIAKFGLDVTNGDTPEEGAPTVAIVTFTPASAGPERVRTTDLTADQEYSTPDEFSTLYPDDAGAHFGPRANGVYRITATVDGLPVANVLYLTVTYGGYGVASWYAEDEAPEPVAQAFWTRHRNTREVV